MKFKHMLFCGAVFKDDKNKIRKSRVFKRDYEEKSVNMIFYDKNER